jgi:anti-sigma factor RsiW
MTEPSSPECAALLANISAYLDGELEAVACATIEHHCAGCPQCAALVDGFRQTIGLCRGVAVASLPDAVRERARENVRRLLESDEGARSRKI